MLNLLSQFAAGEEAGTGTPAPASTSPVPAQTQLGDDGFPPLNMEVRLILQRAQDAQIMVDKYSALQEVTRMASTYQRELGHRNNVIFPIIIDMLPHSSEVCVECLENLIDSGASKVASRYVPRPQSPGEEGQAKPPESVSIPAHVANAHAFLEKGGIEALLSVLQNQTRDSVSIRLSILRLLHQMFKLAEEKVETVIVNSPLGMQQLLQALDDQSEECRNELLQLLVGLTGRSYRPELQNFLAFEEGFERLHSIISQELEENSVTVVCLDCLQIMRNVVRGNAVTSKLYLSMANLASLRELLLIRADDIQEESGEVKPLKRGILLHSVGFLATLLGVADDESDASDAGDADPQLDSTCLRMGSEPGLVEALARVALSHPGALLRAGAGYGTYKLGHQERLKALQVLCRLVRVKGPGQEALVRAVMRDGGGPQAVSVVEALLDHYLSPRVASDEHTAMDRFLYLALAVPEVVKKITEAMLLTVVLLKKKNALTAQDYGLEERDGNVVEQILPGLDAIRASALALDIPMKPETTDIDDSTSGRSPAITTSRDNSPNRRRSDPGAGAGSLLGTVGRGLWGGLAQVVDTISALDEDDARETRKHQSPNRARRRASEGQMPTLLNEKVGEEGLAQLLYRCMHNVVEDPLTGWTVVETAEDQTVYRVGRLIRCWRAQRLMLALLLVGGPAWRAQSLSQTIRCSNLRPPLPQLSGMPISIPFFEACLQCFTYQTSRLFKEEDGGRHEGAFLGVACAQILCAWLTENPLGVKRLLASPCTYKLLDLLAGAGGQPPPMSSSTDPNQIPWRVVLRSQVSSLIATMFSLAVEFLGDADGRRKAVSPVPGSAPAPLAHTRLGLVRMVANRMEISDFLSLVDAGRSIMVAWPYTVVSVVDDEGERGQIMRGLRRRVGAEVQHSFFSAAFVSVMEGAVGAMRARVIASIAEYGANLELEQPDPNMHMAYAQSRGLTPAQCMRLIGEQELIINDLILAIRDGTGLQAVDRLLGTQNQESLPPPPPMPPMAPSPTPSPPTPNNPPLAPPPSNHGSHTPPPPQVVVAEQWPPA